MMTTITLRSPEGPCSFISAGHVGACMKPPRTPAKAVAVPAHWWSCSPANWKAKIGVVACGLVFVAGPSARNVGGRDREPARPVRAVTVSDVDVLARSMIHQAERKRLLVFADNRQDAAFQSGWMQDHARRFRLRGSTWKNQAGLIALGDLAFTECNCSDGDESLSRAQSPEVWRWVPKTAAGNEHQDKRRFYSAMPGATRGI